jgi:hypothetical protein
MKTFITCKALFLCLLFPLLGNAQLVTITGNITNQSTGEFLGSVNIFESNSGIGTISNFDGFFSLMLKPGNAEFLITYAGYKDFSKKLVLRKDTTITVALMPVDDLKIKEKVPENKKVNEKTAIARIK